MFEDGGCHIDQNGISNDQHARLVGKAKKLTYVDTSSRYNVSIWLWVKICQKYLDDVSNPMIDQIENPAQDPQFEP